MMNLDNTNHSYSTTGSMSTHGGGGGAITSASGHASSSPSRRDRRKQRMKQRKKPKDTLLGTPVSGPPTASRMMFTLLMIGLFFCLLDVVYIFRFTHMSIEPAADASNTVLDFVHHLPGALRTKTKWQHGIKMAHRPQKAGEISVRLGRRTKSKKAAAAAQDDKKGDYEEDENPGGFRIPEEDIKLPYAHRHPREHPHHHNRQQQQQHHVQQQHLQQPRHRHPRLPPRREEQVATDDGENNNEDDKENNNNNEDDKNNNDDKATDPPDGDDKGGGGGNDEDGDDSQAAEAADAADGEPDGDDPEEDGSDAEDAKENAAAAAAAAANTKKDAVVDSDALKLPPGITADTTGKEHLLQLLQEAKVPFDDEIVNRLPVWKDVAALYGNEPVVFGLEQSCRQFQSLPDPAEHFISTAGTFNTGTNLMAELLIHNCHMPARMAKYGVRSKGVRWQVLWGKHTPVGNEEFRVNHRTYDEPELQAKNIFPTVMVRDPFKWMQSMCRHPYAAKWHHNSTHCPNLVPNEADKAVFWRLRNKTAVPLNVHYKEFTKHHSSLAGFWNDWYNEYVHAPFPRLIVRFEDVVFHPKEITKIACECAGGQLNKGPFHFIAESAKRGTAHGKDKTGYVDALIKYGTEAGRYHGFEPADLAYAHKHLDPELMRLFGYKFPAKKNTAFAAQQ